MKVALYVILLPILVWTGCQAFQASHSSKWSTSSKAVVLGTSNDDNNCDKKEDDNNKVDSQMLSPSLFSRILSPKIDDRGLPLSDAFAAQIIGPSLQVFWLVSVSAPRPGWLNFKVFGEFRGALLAPTLIHGAALSCCWLLGALVARAFEEEAIDPTINGYSTVVWRIFQAGCFASGCLIFSTQLDLLFEFGRWVQPGDSPEIDTRLLSAWTEVLNDIFFEVIAIVPLRLYLAYSIARDKQ
ncbi:hypothetical protein IV203_008297 [Nitzschia inconspicua]|uniref:Uncharacterized protein n=1 Tax=Nitzschia inconspicua TaxID=303405 RepID=A0A9K3KY94_9STRA|nr:hypothetical protein IV203_008297 [Nitzschia inconspicua]